jgi:lipid-binding SYLF domain-containing protein
MRYCFLLLSLLASSLTLTAETAQERLKSAADIFQEIMAVPEKGIPQELLERANCLVIVPGVKKAAFGVGGQFGKGFVLCRRKSGVGWGPPGAVRVEGGSFGFQIGASSTDVVMLVMNDNGVKKLLSSKFTLGADAEVAAGPVGRNAAAKTDATMHAEILSWSRSRGAFAGVALSGATLRNDLDVNEELYGKKLDNKDIVLSNMPPPAEAKPLIATLNKYSRREGQEVRDRTSKAADRTAEKTKGTVDRTKQKAKEKTEP